MNNTTKNNNNNNNNKKTTTRDSTVYLYILFCDFDDRYQAYIQSKKEQCILKHRQIVPVAAKTQKEVTAIPQDSDSEESGTAPPLPELASSNNFESLLSVEPELVYLCYRGYNHCAAKVVSKSSPK